VLHAHRIVATAFGDAVLGLIPATPPASLPTRRGEPPQTKDRAPRRRGEGVCTCGEVEPLLPDAAVRPVRAPRHAG
jgi:hypothetical protein